MYQPRNKVWRWHEKRIAVLTQAEADGCPAEDPVAQQLSLNVRY